MKENAVILGSKIRVSSVNMVHMKMDEVQEMVTSEIFRELTKGLMNSDKIQITERSDLRNMEKEFEAKVVVLSIEEYRGLKNKIEMFEQGISEIQETSEYLKSLACSQ